MDMVPVPEGRRRFPPMEQMVSDICLPMPTLAEPRNILMVRLTKMGSAAHEGFVCKNTLNTQAGSSYTTTTTPRPIMSVKSLTFEEDF